MLVRITTKFVFCLGFYAKFRSKISNIVIFCSIFLKKVLLILGMINVCISIIISAHNNIMSVRLIHVAGRIVLSPDETLLDNSFQSVFILDNDLALLRWTKRLGYCNPQIHRNLGLMYGLMGYTEDAISALQNSIDCAPDYDLLHFWLGEIYQRLNSNDKAIIEWREAGAAPYFFNLGQLLSDNGLHSKALEAYLVADAIEPLGAVGHYSLGWEYWNLNRWEETIQELYITTEIDPTFARAYYLWGMAEYSGMRNTPNAVVAFRKAVEADPNYLAAYLALGNLTREQKNYAEAENWYYHAYMISPTNIEALIGLGASRYMQGDMPMALEYFWRAVTLDPDSSKECALRLGSQDGGKLLNQILSSDIVRE